ncbi:hypothetical protein TTHERM_00283380 (macronuclear) [Tetrahymena thermophila SB210]|uniref:Uncharacterized protein n=1 Tax=Tetrahymena thermophila (strain SB210) TaxID=312017 RepID=I7M8E9_TETTS|nr:hypothetical protein TTHERM_00283380 [Tetrahymena thermophila SB210]EAR97949.2 hypothetical protein TTHERM_00283380 [Tetrahymena thermophila SB210]|eukprot:XP_001018194.2 hypothetical protein TTHERM_00283380 [Tetrahymena thermophila SB210]
MKMRNSQFIYSLKQNILQITKTQKRMSFFCQPLVYKFSQNKNNNNKQQNSNQAANKNINLQSAHNQNIKTLSVKFQDLMECMYKSQYEKGIEMTKKYIQEKERNFGKSYEGYEDDLLLLSQFTLESSEENAIQQSIQQAINSLEICLKKKNIKTGIQCYMHLFSIWWDAQDFPEIKEFAKNMKDLAESLETYTENRFEIINTMSQISQEEGDFQNSIELLEEYAGDLERTFQMLRSEGESLNEKNESGLDEDDLKDEQELISRRLFSCLLTIARVYQSLADCATVAREWETVQKYMDCTDQILTSLSQEYSDDKGASQIIKSLKAKSLLFKSKQQSAIYQYDKALESLQSSLKLIQENPNLYEQHKIFYFSALALHYEERQDLQNSLKYINLIDQQPKKGKMSQIQKCRDSLQYYVKAITYSKLKNEMLSFQYLQKYLETQNGKSNRNYNKITNLNTQAIYYESINEFQIAIEKMRECDKISEKYYGIKSAIHQNTLIYLYKLNLLKIKFENSFEENKSLLIDIKNKSQERLKIIKSKQCYGQIEQQFEELLNECCTKINLQ